MIELGKLQGSIVKRFPETFNTRIKLAAASFAFVLATFLSAGSVDEVRIANPIEEDGVPVYLQNPEEEIDYEEFLNRLPLRKPAPKPPFLDWFSETRTQIDFG